MTTEDAGCQPIFLSPQPPQYASVVGIHRGLPRVETLKHRRKRGKVGFQRGDCTDRKTRCPPAFCEFHLGRCSFGGGHEAIQN